MIRYHMVWYVSTTLSHAITPNIYSYGFVDIIVNFEVCAHYS